MDMEPNREEIYQVVYTSHTTAKFNEGMLVSLLNHARRTNANLGLTGALMYHAGFFAQCLEGPAEVVSALLERIIRDERHHNFVIVFEQTTTKRAFPKWFMGGAAILDSNALRLSTVEWEALEQTSSALNPASPGFVLMRSLWEAHSAEAVSLKTARQP